MKAYIKIPTNSVDEYLSIADVYIRRTKRKTFPKAFNIEVGDILVRCKLQAKVIDVNRRNREIIVTPHGQIHMNEKLFRGNFFDYSYCISGGKIVREDYFISETIICVIR